ncbi:odorant receptor 33b-like [Teleopsis dalmanni]|uniref:odorant receptor 33b-like n=1 Tax=Teleopsis dalmanni TaxID=139649 RepID=UPI0018CE2D9E|nr:odorant receptor 33b-like [Teleopsis dalmanni]
MSVSSVAIFNRYAMSWKMLGINTGRNKYLCGLYDIFVTLFMTINFPLHLNIGLLQSKTQGEIISNLVVNVAASACSVKQFILRRKLTKLNELNEIFGQLDGRVIDKDEQLYFQKIMLRDARFLLNTFITIYVSVSAAAILALLMDEERRLLLPGFFPFDWRATNLSYLCAVGYQFVGLSMQVLQNFANDVCGPLSLCMYAGHVHLLSMRVSKIGHNADITPEQNYTELIACIEDYKKLMRMFIILQDTLSSAMFVQFVCSGFNICVAVVSILFFADNLFAIVNAIVLLIAISVEVFPACYYGSMLQLEFRDLPYSIFSSNWVMQSRKFRYNVVIFVEMSLKEVTAYAGGMVRIHIDSFFATCKLAYSFFALIQTMK